MNKKTDWRKIAKYLSEDISVDVDEYVSNWIKDNPARKKSLIYLKEAGVCHQYSMGERDVEKAWIDVEAKMDKVNFCKPKSFSDYLEKYKSFFGLRSPLAIGFKFAGIILILLSVSFLTKDLWKYKQVEHIAEQIVTEKGEKASIRLTDGTNVVLNAASCLKLSEKFNDSREVYLEGEAYFVVTHDDDRPFIVHVGEADIEVLGTAFDIRAWDADKKIELVVTKGKVSFQSTELSGKKVILTKNQKSMLIPGDEPSDPIAIDGDQYIAWIRGELIFSNTLMEDVIVQLERKYNIDIQLSDSTFLERHLTASFSKEPIDDILSTMAQSLGLKYERSGRFVLFRPTYN